MRHLLQNLPPHRSETLARCSDPAFASWRLSSLLVAVLLILGLTSGCSTEPSAGAGTSREAPSSSDIKTVVVKFGPIQEYVTLVGQVNPTEHGRADVTTPLQGIVIDPLVKVGQNVGRGSPLAEINSVYGQTSMQLQQKIEADESTAVSDQNAYQTALTTLGQTRAQVAQAEVTRSQSVDNRAQDEAEVANATTDYHRKQKMFAAGVNSQSDVDDARERYVKARVVLADADEQLRLARRGVEIAQKNLEPADENVKLTGDNVRLAQRQVEHDRVVAQGALNPVGSQQTQFYIRSPIAGTVIALNMSAGLAVSPGTVLATVVDTTSLYVDANAYASDLRGVHVGDPLEVHVDGFPNETFRGRVSYIGRQMDPNTRTVAVRALIRNKHDDLRPGLFVQAVLTPASPRQVLTVPNEAVLVDGQESYVVVIGGAGKYEKRKIKEGIRTDTTTEILEGLKPGEHVVTHGNILVVPD